MWSELPDDVREEITNERYKNRKHYSRSTYAEGCHGPLCRKAERDRGRKRNAKRANEAGRIYTPNHEARVPTEEEKKLQVILEWYLALEPNPTQLAEAV